MLPQRNLERWMNKAEAEATVGPGATGAPRSWTARLPAKQLDRTPRPPAPGPTPRAPP